MVRTDHPLLFCFFLLFLSVSCSSGGRNDREELRRLIGQRDYQGAHQLLDDSKFYKDEKSSLLLHLEKGVIFHLEKNYSKSIKSFEQAKKISQDLYTKSLSSTAKTLIANDNYDLYYGAPYERSHIHFYQSLNYFFLYQNEPLDSQSRQTYLFQSRAEILAWDAVLNEYSQDGYLAGHFQNDLMAKLYGGLIHEAFELRDEQQIALQLYKDALDILLKQYNSYPSFNLRSKEFLKDFEKLSKFSVKDLNKNYIEKTQHQKQLEFYIKRKILELTLILFPQDKSQTIKRYSIPKEVIEFVSDKRKSSNVVVIIQEGLIPEKAASEQYIGFDYAQYESEGAKILAAVGAVALTVFATERLGLAPAPIYWTPTGAHLGLELSHALVKGFAISFELPVVRSPEINDTLVVEYNDQKQEMALVQPLGDIAEKAVALDSVSRYAKVGGRLLVKHLTAIAASFASYKAMRKDGDESRNSFALGLASLQYVAAAQAIKKSEQADTRYWSTLPQNFRLLDLQLPEGEHELFLNIIGDNNAEDRRLSLGKVSIGANFSGKIVLSPRVF